MSNVLNNNNSNNYNPNNNTSNNFHTISYFIHIIMNAFYVKNKKIRMNVLVNRPPSNIDVFFEKLKEYDFVKLN